MAHTRRAKLTIRKGYTLEIELQPGFVLLKFKRKGALRQASHIPNEQWCQLVKWINAHPQDPTNSVDPILEYRKEWRLQKQIKLQARALSERSSRHRRRNA